MSLLPTEHLTVVLGPDQVGIVRRPAGLRRQPPGQVELLVLTDNTGWQQPLDALEYWLEKAEVKKGVSASVTVSNSWGRFALAPWSAVVGSEAEETSLASACLESAYGDMTSWTLGFGTSRYGQPRIVCALETALLDRLFSILRAHNIVCRSLHPYFMLAFRRAGDIFSRPASVFAVAESGTYVLASTRHGCWNSLRSLRSELSSEKLASLLQREVLLQSLTEEPALAAMVPGMAQEKISGVTLVNAGENSFSPVRAMVLEAAASSARTEVDFAPDVFSKGRLAGLASFLIMLGFAAWTGWGYLKLAHEGDRWQADLQRMHRSDSQPRSANSPEEQERVKSELRFANSVIEKLDTPWDRLFGAVESTFNEQVTLLSVEPDTERNEVRLTAEAKDMKAMLDYVQQLRRSSMLKNGYLVDHQINQQDPQRPVRFTVAATWNTPPSEKTPKAGIAGGQL